MKASLLDEGSDVLQLHSQQGSCRLRGEDKPTEAEGMLGGGGEGRRVVLVLEERGREDRSGQEARARAVGATRDVLRPVGWRGGLSCAPWPAWVPKWGFSNETGKVGRSAQPGQGRHWAPSGSVALVPSSGTQTSLEAEHSSQA